MLAALAETDEVKNAAASRQRRLELQTSYGYALLHAKGAHAPEPKEAFGRARELAASIEDPLQRFSTYYGLWVGAYVRWEIATMAEVADALLQEAEHRADLAEAGIAQRIYGTTCWATGGDVATARKCFEHAIALYRPERDRELALRFGQDVGVTAKMAMALIQWVLGECNESRTALSDVLELAAKTNHTPTSIYARGHAAWYEMIRLDPVRARLHAVSGLALAREHGLEMWDLLLPPIIAWADACAGKTEAECEKLRANIAAADEQRLAWIDPIARPLLAACEAEAGQFEVALATADQAIAEAGRSGIRYFEAEAHRIRGEILLKRDPANTAPAEGAFLTAIAIAQQQKARSFELRAALSLAKHYQSSGRYADAHPVLAPAMEGFSPTPEFPEIEEAKRLLAALE